MASDLAEAALAIAQGIQSDANEIRRPPPEGARAQTDWVLDRTIVAGTRRYIEHVAEQINGCYEQGWYDACSVMIRRLVETLIIEAFEHHKIDAEIKGPTGDFLYLADLIARTLSCTSWNLSRNTKQALPRLKDIGDKSAHSRRFLARRRDVDRVIPDLRVVAEELVHLSR